MSVFTVCYHVVFWMCGAARSLSWDYLPAIPQGEDAEQRLSWKEKPIGRFVARALRVPPGPSPPHSSKTTQKDEERNVCTPFVDDKDSVETLECCPESAIDIPRVIIVGEERVEGVKDALEADIVEVPRTPTLTAPGTFRSRNLTLVIPPSPLRSRPIPPSPFRSITVSQAPEIATMPPSPAGNVISPSPIRSIAPSNTTRAVSIAGSLRSLAPGVPLRAVHSIHSLEDPAGIATLDIPTEGTDSKHRTCASLREKLAPLLKPVTVSLALSLPIALIQPLKALFVDCTATGCPAWFGPDGRPVLAFVMDTGVCSDSSQSY